MRMQTVLQALRCLLSLIGMLCLSIVMLWGSAAILPVSSKPGDTGVILWGWIAFGTSSASFIHIIKQVKTGLFGRMLRSVIIVVSTLIHFGVLAASLFLMIICFNSIRELLVLVPVVFFSCVMLIVTYRTIRSSIIHG